MPDQGKALPKRLFGLLQMPVLVPRQNAEGRVQVEPDVLDERRGHLHAIDREPLGLVEQRELRRLQALEGRDERFGPLVAPGHERGWRLHAAAPPPADAGQGTHQRDHDAAEQAVAIARTARWPERAGLVERGLEPSQVGFTREVQVRDALGGGPRLGRRPAAPGLGPGGLDEASEAARGGEEVLARPCGLSLHSFRIHALAYAGSRPKVSRRSRTHAMEYLLRYLSTRGHGPVSLAEALLAGPAPDGGLYLPERFVPPDRTVPGDAHPHPAGAFAEVATGVLAPYLAPDLARPALEPLLADALDFDVPSIPLDEAGPGTTLLDLTLGPSGAFKDVAAGELARLLAHLTSTAGGPPRTVLVATSGDTGGAVARAFEGLGGFRVVVLFPLDGVSPVQRRVFTAAGDNVQAIGVRGDFDACQRLARQAFADPALRVRYGLTSANSLNVGRLLPQMAYYPLAAGRLGAAGAPTFVVPSGNLGNLTAGVMAARAGLATAGFVAALNANDQFARYLAGGAAGPGDAEAATVRTLSNAMDVSRPSNLERLRALADDDPAKLSREVRAASVDDAETRRTMRGVWERRGLLIDPHTAVGVAALERLRRAGQVRGPAVVLATAHPGKFPELVREVTGQDPPTPPGLADVAERAERRVEAEPTLDALVPFLDQLAEARP